MLAVQLYAVRLAVQPLLQPLLGLCLFFGFPDGLLLGFRFQAQSFGPRLGALLLALLFASVAFAADRLQIGLEIIGTVIVVDLFAGRDVLDRANHDLALARADV